MNFIDIPGAIVANTVYIDDKLSAKDTTITLPSVTFPTTEHKAMGTMTLPMIGQVDDMEVVVKKIGIDMGLGKMVALKTARMEVRWVQNVVNENGEIKQVGCKAFLRVIPKGIPGLSVDYGNATENDLASAVTRYQIFVDGQEICLIDKLAQILKINGTDYFDEISSLL